MKSAFIFIPESKISLEKIFKWRRLSEIWTVDGPVNLLIKVTFSIRLKLNKPCRNCFIKLHFKWSSGKELT